MPPQARVGDSSQVAADAHGCPTCPHTSIGPATQGSCNVLTNGRPSVRVGDMGIHAACCGPNTWNAKTGSSSVLINGRKAHRLADLVQHCGGIGQTIQGSSNVDVGDLGGAKRENISRSSESIKKHWIEFRILTPGGRPIAGAKCRIELPDGDHVESSSNEFGVIRIEQIMPGICKVRFLST